MCCWSAETRASGRCVSRAETRRERANQLELAGGEGFEPPLSESESEVLPLDDPPVAGPTYVNASNTVSRAVPCAALLSYALLPWHHG